MIRLKHCGVFQREIRQDDPMELALPTFTLAVGAMEKGDFGTAAALVEYGCAEDTRTHDSFVMLISELATRLADFDEQEVEKIQRQKYFPRAQSYLSKNPSVETLLQRGAESQRSHHGNFAIAEERDRYVVTCDPCGSGGRLRRVAKNIGVTKKPYPWSWSKAGVPYYCCHCAILNEIAPIEIRGYPIRVTLPGDKPEDPCVHYYYRKPELIPEEYFTRVGKTKTIQ